MDYKRCSQMVNISRVLHMRASDKNKTKHKQWNQSHKPKQNREVKQNQRSAQGFSNN